MTTFTVTRWKHFAFGPLLRLEGPHLRLDLTPGEAATVSRALIAVMEGRSSETEIFLSPIASNGEFAASVGRDGVTLVGSGPLDWPSVAELAGRLAGDALVGNPT